jgi:hypothetical protein
MLARKAVASHGIRQSPSRRMDIPANREDPACRGRRSWCEREQVWRRGTRRRSSAMQFRDAWPFSPDLRHFRQITAAVERESIEMSETRASKP